MVEIIREKNSQWVKRWDESQWNSPEWRRFVISLIEDGEVAMDELKEIKPIYEEQVRYIKLLERQLELLQKTLDLAEKLAPRPIFIPGSSEVTK